MKYFWVFPSLKFYKFMLPTKRISEQHVSLSCPSFRIYSVAGFMSSPLCPLSSQNHSGLVCMWGPWACAFELELCWCQVCLTPHSCSHLISSFGSLHSMATTSNSSLRSSWYSYGGKLMSTRIVASLSWEAS